MISWDMVGSDLLVGVLLVWTPVCIVLSLATGGMPVSVVQF
jgi:hypothetical protein